MTTPLRIWTIAQAAGIGAAAELDAGKLILILQATATICVSIASLIKSRRDGAKRRKPTKKKPTNET